MEKTLKRFATKNRVVILPTFLLTLFFWCGDWFVANAAVPPLYHDLLQLPGRDQDLEKELHLNVFQNLKEGLALRAGFNGSGVSRNNRLIERHTTFFGVYWKSYDFAGMYGLIESRCWVD